jgi:ubiquinone biosynthesis protein
MAHLNVIERLERNTRRFAEIGAVLVKYGLADWLRKLPGGRMRKWLRDSEGQAIPGLSTEVRLRLALTELGPTFIKVGQTMSTRPDLVGPVIASELSRLQSETPPDPAATAVAILEQELGRPVGEIFAAFDPVPLASASMAQVHAARLHTGEEVVAKIQHPGIEKRIEADLGILEDLADQAEKHLAEVKPYRPVEIVRQLKKMLLQELDLTREAHNLEEFRRNFDGDETVHFPRPYPEFSSRRVLTMERLDGVLVSRAERVRSLGMDLDRFARRGAHMYLDMIFRDSFYHADPHPGNLMLLPGEVVGVLDCGLVQRLDPELRESIEDMLLAVVRGDAEALTDVVWNLGTTPPRGSRQQLNAELAEYIAEYTRRPLNELDLSGALTSITDIIRRNHIFLPPPLSLMIRTLAELEGTAQLLNPGFNLAEVIRPYYRRTIGHRFSPRRLLRRFQRGSRDWDRLLGSLPRDLGDMMQRARSGTLRMHLEHRHLDPVVNRLVLGLLTSSLFLGSSLLWSMEAPPLVRGVSLFGAIGYGLALFTGLRLFRLIKRSEIPYNENT